MRSCDQRSPVQSGAGSAPTLSAMNERAHCRCKAGLSLNRMSVNGLTIALRSATKVSSRGRSSVVRAQSQIDSAASARPL